MTSNYPAISRRPLTRPFLLLASVAAGLGLALLSGCNKAETAEARTTVKNAVAETRAAMSDAWMDAKAFTFDQREKFTANATAISSRMEARLSEARANYAEATASASRRAAIAELKSAESDYKAKVAALGQATADTWESATRDTIAAWDRMQASCDKARAD